MVSTVSTGSRFNIDSAALKEIADLGIRRASVFVGIGVNAARLEPLLPYVLEQTQFHVVPLNVTEDVRSEFARNSEIWIISNGLREIVESFSVFLNNIYHAALLFENSHEVNRAEIEKKLYTFDHEGVAAQLTKIGQILNLDNRFVSMFSSLNVARNCLSHRGVWLRIRITS